MSGFNHLLRYLAIALAFLFSAGTAAAGDSKGKVLAFVVQRDAEAAAVASDGLAQAHLEKRGYQVRLIDQADPVSRAVGADAILISASVSTNKMGAKYRHVAQPVVLWEANMLPILGMTGRKEGSDYGTKERERYLWVVNSGHAAAGGLAPGYVNVQKKNVPMGWGKPGLGATIIGTFPGEDDRVGAFIYEAGSTMDYENVAPAKRAFIFVETANFGDMNEDGLKAFDGIVAWAAGNK